MAILNTSGEAVVEYTYDAWGKLYSTIGTLAGTPGEFDLPWICVQLRSGPGLSPERIFRYQSRSVSSSMGMDCQPHGKMGRTHW